MIDYSYQGRRDYEKSISRATVILSNNQNLFDYSPSPYKNYRGTKIQNNSDRSWRFFSIYSKKKQDQLKKSSIYTVKSGCVSYSKYLKNKFNVSTKHTRNKKNVKSLKSQRWQRSKENKGLSLLSSKKKQSQIYHSKGMR